MAKPADKSKGVEEALDRVSEDMFGRRRTMAIRNDICVMCGAVTTMFRDEKSRKEYAISGMCQKCQDEMFGGEE